MYKSLILLDYFLVYSGRYGSNFIIFQMTDKEIFFNRELVQNTPENAFFRKRSCASAKGIENYSKGQFS